MAPVNTCSHFTTQHPVQYSGYPIWICRLNGDSAEQRLAPHILIPANTGVCGIFAPCKAKSSNQALLTGYCVRGHKIIISHLICQIRNALHFLDFASWCKDSAIPSTSLASFPGLPLPLLAYRRQERKKQLRELLLSFLPPIR